MQLGVALAELGILPVNDLADFLGDRLDQTAEHVRLWRIARAASSDTLTLHAGRNIGAALVRESIETELSELQNGWDVALDSEARADLTDFSRRL